MQNRLLVVYVSKSAERNVYRNVPSPQETTYNTVSWLESPYQENGGLQIRQIK